MGFFWTAGGEPNRRCNFQGRVRECRKLCGYGSNGSDIAVKSEACETVFRWLCRTALENIGQGTWGQTACPVLKSGLLWQSMLSTCMPRQGLQREVCTSFSVGPSSCYIWFSEPRPWVEPRPWLWSALSAACNLAQPCSGSSSSLSFFRGFALCLHVYSKRSFQQARPSLTRRCPSS